MKHFVLTLLWLTAKGIFAAVRFFAFVLLLLIGRLLVPLAALASGLGLLLFLFCAVFCPSQTTPMWAGAGLAVGSTVVVLAYHALLGILAPDGWVIFTDL